MSAPLSPHELLDLWHRRLSPVTAWLVLSGDLHHLRHRAEAQIERWRAAKITAVIDVRQEWTDKAVVAEIAPELRYWHFGTHDNGGHQDDAWFEAGLHAYREAVNQPGARLLVHCHMGINRGPSMGYRLLLEAGEEPLKALDAIRRARPIAQIDYAGDALDHFHRATKASRGTRERDQERLEAWMADHGIVTAARIRRIRSEFS